MSTNYFRIPEITVDGYVITKQRSLAYSPVTGGVTMLNLFSSGASTEFKTIESITSPTSGITLVGRNSQDHIHYFEVDSSNTIVDGYMVVLDPGTSKVKTAPLLGSLGSMKLLGRALNPINTNLFPPYQSTPPTQQLLMVQKFGEAYIYYAGSVTIGDKLGLASATLAGAVSTYSSGPVVGIALENGGDTFTGKVRVQLNIQYA